MDKKFPVLVPAASSSAFYYQKSGENSPTSILQYQDEENGSFKNWVDAKSSTSKPFSNHVKFCVRDRHVSLCRIKGVPSSLNQVIHRCNKIS